MFVEGANEGHLVNLIFLLARYSNGTARGAKRFPLVAADTDHKRSLYFLQSSPHSTHHARGRSLATHESRVESRSRPPNYRAAPRGRVSRHVQHAAGPTPDLGVLGCWYITVPATDS